LRTTARLNLIERGMDVAVGSAMQLSRLAQLLVLATASTSIVRADPTATTVRGEVIEIHDPPRPTVMPKPLADPAILPPYSDKAILGDVWTRAWLLLDVDDTGGVARVKFLKRPGADLDRIAIDHAFKLRFAPARDRWSHAARAYVVWKIEWPSYGWMIDRVGTATRMPKYDQLSRFERGAVNPNNVPCRGSGPLNLGSVHPVYRDCSVPDLAHVDAREPWTSAPARVAGGG
jgi:hypothetical protein